MLEKRNSGKQQLVLIMSKLVQIYKKYVAVCITNYPISTFPYPNGIQRLAKRAYEQNLRKNEFYIHPSNVKTTPDHGGNRTYDRHGFDPRLGQAYFSAYPV